MFRLTKVEDGSKCPKCSFIGRSFLLIDDTLSACMDCGCVFLLKRKRLEIRQQIADRQKGVVIEDKKPEKVVGEEEGAINPLKCDHPGCDFVGKTSPGLKGHRSSRH